MYSEALEVVAECPLLSRSCAAASRFLRRPPRHSDLESWYSRVSSTAYVLSPVSFEPEKTCVMAAKLARGATKSRPVTS